MRGNLLSVDLLLKKRADPRVQDDLGATPQLLAKSKGFMDVSDHLNQFIKRRNSLDEQDPACCKFGELTKKIKSTNSNFIF